MKVNRKEVRMEAGKRKYGQRLILGLVVFFLFLVVLNPGDVVFAAGDMEDEVTVTGRDWEKFSGTYVYERLNEDEKALYDDMYAIAYHYLTTTEDMGVAWAGGCNVPGTLSARGMSDSQVMKVINLFTGANPQFYFLHNGYGGSPGQNNRFCLTAYGEFSDGKKRAEVTNQIFDEVEEWAGKIRGAGDTRYARVLAANNMLCNNLTYFHSEFNQSIYSVFIDRSTVCRGYGLAYSLLMNYCDVPTVSVFGNAHLWNKSQLDNGKWYATDVTWNDYPGHREYYLNRADAHMLYSDTNKVHQIAYPEYFPETDTEDYIGDETHFVIYSNDDGSLSMKRIKESTEPEPGYDPELAPDPEPDGTVNAHDWERYMIAPEDEDERYLDMSSVDRILYQNMYQLCLGYLITSKTMEPTSGEGSKGVIGKLACGSIDGSKAVSIFHSFLHENPQFYFVEYAPMVSTVNGANTTITIYAKPEYLDGEVRAACTNQIFEELDHWLDIINSFDTRYERVRAANEILCREFSYESTESRDDDVSLLLRKKTHYQGYSWAMYYLMRMSDVPVYILYSDKNSYVAWNKVCLDGDKWYNIDVTWNDLEGSYPTGFTRYLNLSDEHLEVMDKIGYHKAYRAEKYPACDSDLITEDNLQEAKQKSDGTWYWSAINQENREYAGHSWEEGKIVRESTCSVHGSRVSVCRICGMEKKEELPLLQHTVVVDPAKAPTYTATGLTEGSHCSKCGKVIKKQETVPKLQKQEPQKQEPKKPVKTKYSNEWVKNVWYDKKGYATKYTMKWKKDKTGWWIVDNTGWYPKNSWQKIDGVWYYFKPNGYMAANEWYKGYWFNKNGAWTYKYKGSWHKEGKKWWFGDTSGWYAKSTTIWIDGKKYSFDKKGYLI